MILSNSGTNELIIGTDSYYTLESGNTIELKNQETNEIKTFYLINSKNDRYISWNFEIVTDSTYEDLSNYKIYLKRGFYLLTIYNNTDVIYIDNMFIDINSSNIPEIDNDDDIIYTIPD